jgi:hypothetical protein
MQTHPVKQGIIMALAAFITVALLSFLSDGEIDWVLSSVMAGGFILGGLLTYKWQKDMASGNHEKDNIKRVILEEGAPYSGLMKLLIYLVLLILASIYSITIFGHFFGINKSYNGAPSFIIMGTGIYILAMWSFLNIKFRITGNSVEALMPPFKFTIPFNEITNVKTVEKIPWYVGWGLRLWGRRIAFVSMHKKAVIVEKKNGFFRGLVLTTQDPDEFIKKIRSAEQPDI